MAQIPEVRVVKGPYKKQYVGTVSHLLVLRISADVRLHAHVHRLDFGQSISFPVHSCSSFAKSWEFSCGLLVVSCVVV